VASINIQHDADYSSHCVHNLLLLWVFFSWIIPDYRNPAWMQARYIRRKLLNEWEDGAIRHLGMCPFVIGNERHLSISCCTADRVPRCHNGREGASSDRLRNEDWHAATPINMRIT
jgi:hypothetical protein